MTPGGSSSPRRIFSWRSSNSCRLTSMRPLGQLLDPRSFSSIPKSSSATLGAHEHGKRDVAHDVLRQHGALAQHALASVLVEEIAPQLSTGQVLHHPLLHFFVKNPDLVLQVLLHHLEFFGLDRLRAVVLLDPLAGEDPHPDDDASMPGGQSSDASFTSPAFSPKMARRSFSSGVSCVSPFGVTLPTRMSPGLT